MITTVSIIVILSFILTFFFTLGGLGSAMVLVPIIFYLGFPIKEAKPVGLFISGISLIAATILNIKNKRIYFRMGIPIIISTPLFAFLGTLSTKFIPDKIVLIFFTIFLIISALFLAFSKSNNKAEDSYREKTDIITLIVIGAFVGFVSGLLGIGGGIIFSIIFIMFGFHPKKVIALTPLIVLFSSFTGFATYAIMGYINLDLIIFGGIASFLGGYLGTKVTHLKLNTTIIKRIIALFVAILVVKMIIQIH
ncbi:MAG: sulfite exporter TauE/SafE family protein [Thermoplasmata archaeon]